MPCMSVRQATWSLLTKASRNSSTIQARPSRTSASGGGGAKANKFSPTVVRGGEARQVGIHPNFFLAALVDPRMKHFPPEISNADKETVKAEMAAKMVKASLKDAPAAAPVAAVGASCFSMLTS